MNAKMKVLLVDDEPQFRETTGKILRRRGFDTILAGDGEEALLRLAEQPDVVVLDIKMPGMDGLAVLGEIRRRAPNVPVIMLTGHGSGRAAQTALEQGAADFLAKPCDVDLLVLKIREVRESAAPSGRPVERRVEDVMVPVGVYTTIRAGDTVAEAVLRLKKSFVGREASDSIMETGHRSVLILDEEQQVVGILTIQNLLQAVMPAYLGAPKPSTADSVQYSPMFWGGMFRRAIEALAGQRIEEIMSPAPPVIRHDANLMEAAYTLLQSGVRRLVVLRGREVVGVIREQDLFFEMERILGG